MANKVTKDSIVKVHYIGTFPKTDDIFDTSRKEIAKDKGIYTEKRDYAPLEVKMGEKQVIVGFENALLDMKEGERKKVTIPPEQAYGQPTEQRIVDVPSTNFDQADVKPEKGMLIQTQQGIAAIVDIDEDQQTIKLDFNHPLAGKTLEFDLEVVEVKQE